MAQRALRPCKKIGCNKLVSSGYCNEHKHLEKQRDRDRGTAFERGYNYRWRQYSKWFLKQPGNQLCKLKLDDGCKYIAECVDHIVPHNGNQQLFWDRNNHQSSCIHCNSVKGNRTVKG